MFTSPAPSRAGSRRPAGNPPQATHRQPQSAFQTPPHTPRLGGGNPLQVGSPFSGQNVSRYQTPMSTLRHPLRQTHNRVTSPGTGSEMEVDADAQDSTSDIYTNRPELSVHLTAPLPIEVQQALGTSDFDTEAYSGGVDHETGHCHVISPTTCFLWSTSVTSSPFPTCYIFPMPPATSRDDKLMTSYASLALYGHTREPGLVIASGRGQIRFWEALGAGLSGGEHFLSIDLNLETQEYLMGLYRYDNLKFMVVTSGGRVFRVNVITSGGKLQLASSALGAGGSGAISRMTSLIPFLGSSAPAPTSTSAALALAFGKGKHSRDVYVLTQDMVQKWEVSSDSWEQMAEEFDLRAALKGNMKRNQQHTAPGSLLDIDLELLDITTASDGQLFVLYSYSSGSDAPSTLRSYAVARFTTHNGLTANHKICYDIPRDPRPGTAPKMVLVDDGAAVVVQFGGAVVVASVAHDTSFSQTLTVKSRWNRSLGVGGTKFGVSNDATEVMLIMAHNGLLTFKVDHEKIKEYHDDTPTSQLKTTLEQAIFYGSREENPFAFSLSSRVDGNLDSAACSLSREILNSQAELMTVKLDLRVHLKDRAELLRSLILFINDNKAAGLLSASGKANLSMDAEKLAIAANLWTHVNTDPDSRSSLVNAVVRYMESVGVEYEDDPVRIFFRARVDKVDELFKEIDDLVRLKRADLQRTYRPNNILQAANRITLNALVSTNGHREATKALYNLDESSLRLPRWTCTVEQLNILRHLFDTTSECLDRWSRELGGQQSDDVRAGMAELLDQLNKLGEGLRFAYKEREAHLESLAQETGDDRELQALQQQHAKASSHIQQRLLHHGQVHAAFGLAQSNRDFSHLAQLCNNPEAMKIVGMEPSVLKEAYIDQYGEAFAFALYQWYTDNGQQQQLLQQAARHQDLLSSYLETHAEPSISWLHYIATGQFDRAVTALESKAQGDHDVGHKKVTLSLTKLCALAQLQSPSQIGQGQQLLSYENDLELVSTHELLRAEFQAIINQELEAHNTVDATRIDQPSIVTASAPLGNRPQFQTLFKKLVRQVLAGNVLRFEDLIDVLTLKAQPIGENDFLNGFLEAALVLVRSRGLPPGRMQNALATIWRRALIHDDWREFRNTSGLMDAEMEERLQQTALYQLMVCLRSREDCRPLWRRPSDGMVIPTPGEISARFPEFSEVQVNAFRADYEEEQTLLEEYGDSLGLDEIYDEAFRLSGKP